MIFASFEFLFLFLPLFLAVYFVTPFAWRNWPILIFSWAFYAWWRVDFLALLISVTVFTFVVARIMARVGPKTVWGRRLLVVGLVGNLGVLAVFKYANFSVQALNDLLGGIGHAPVAWAEIVLPIGLSFYVLQSVSYLIDVWRGDIPVSRSFLNYAAYKAVFAQLIAGPIVRYAEVAEELKHRAHSWAQFGLGARRFAMGFAAKVCIADTLSPAVDAVYALPQPSLVDAWAGALAYTLQLYFDFAGYSSMALGLALMLGFHFPENFRDPYLSGSIQEFWQRWHMTLSRFLRDYLYIPLGGSRKGQRRTYVNLFLTMLLGGFWHGANWTFLAWGAWQGGLLTLHRAWRRAGHGPMPWLPAHLLTLLVVLLGWVAFRAPDFASAVRMYGAMLGGPGLGLSDALAWQITPDQWWCGVIAILLVYAPLLERRLAPGPDPAPPGHPLVRAATAVGPLLAFVLGLVLLYSRAAVPFLYFQF